MDYIRFRVTAEERQILEGMVATGEAATLSDAVRKCAFGRKVPAREFLNNYLQEISGAHNTLAELVRSGIARDKLTEADVVLMEREVRRVVQNAAKLTREFRKWPF